MTTLTVRLSHRTRWSRDFVSQYRDVFGLRFTILRTLTTRTPAPTGSTLISIWICRI